MTANAFQDSMPDNHCFGCGAENPDGLQIKSVWTGPGESLCRYRPRPHQSAGPRGFLNGGILATLLDCHGVCTAWADHYRRHGRPLGAGEPVWYVTGGLTLDFRKPTPIDSEVEVRARILEAGERKTVLECAAWSAGVRRVEARVVAVRVAWEWRAGHDHGLA